MRRHAATLFALALAGCSANKDTLKTEFLTNTCISPLKQYRYLTCSRIDFTIENKTYFIPKHFETDLASIPRIIWPIISPAHSSLIKPAIVHDWFYRKTCEFSRKQTDLIFYHMLRNEGISNLEASLMYYTVRLFGWRFYNEDYCDDEQRTKGLD